ncbi:MAG: carbohydrate kinase family protein [Planctomycetota bacterium]|jgi:sugar/nucleoside kinase (ribokinase family)
MNQDKEIEVVVAGHICLDVIPSFKKTDKLKIGELLVPGKLINMEEVNISTGGPVSNTGIALSKLGIKIKLMGKIGDDFFGRGVLELLKKIDADDGMTVTKGEQTSYTVVIVPPGIDRIFLHNPGANNTFRADDINYELVKKAKIFHFGYPPLMKKIFENDGAELIKIFKKVKELGVSTSLDMSLPDLNSESGQVNWDKILQELLPYVDIYIPSVEETLFMVARDEFNRLNKMSENRDILEGLDVDILPELGKKLASYGGKIVVIKCGVKGYYIKTPDKQTLADIGKGIPYNPENWANRQLLEESFQVPDIASATGSGDSSIAGFLAAFLKGKTIEETVRFACAVGGLNLTRFDALSGIRSWKETVEIIENGWKKNRLQLQDSIWTYDDANQIWVLAA